MVGTAILALIVAFAVGEGLPNPLNQPLDVILLSVAMLTMVVGLVMAWRWERIGGLLVLGGLAFFAIVNHGVQLNVVFGPMLVVGLLYSGCGWWWRKACGPCGTTSSSA
jgi:NADH:ubiquinone oxidoreductase subunit 2 (subunit N)